MPLADPSVRIPAMNTLRISNGRVIDPAQGLDEVTDLWLRDDRVVGVGPHPSAHADRTLDAAGKLVTPGWVDVHTHYDGQATWDPMLAPSSWHGATTIRVGNCGVGFAPGRRQDRECLIDLMEGGEDIPGIALAEGLKWNWESFPQFLDALEQLPRTIDVGAHQLMVTWWYRIVPMRSYVKGWKISPSHYLNQDLANVWLDK